MGRKAKITAVPIDQPEEIIPSVDDEVKTDAQHMTDIINEYFCKQGVRKLSIFTAGLIAYAFIIIFFAIQLSPADWWITQNKAQGVENMQTSFKVIFGQGILMVFGSLTAFLVAQLVDVLLFHQIKKIT